MSDEVHIRQLKAKSKSDINLWLLAITFTLFTFIIAVNPSLVKNNVFLSLQLTLAIPFLSSSIFARTRLGYSEQPATWDLYGFITFILAYGFLVNVVGILLSTLVSTTIGLIFWIVNMLSALCYSLLEVIEDKAKTRSRFYKDIVFILIILLAGIFPVFGLY